MTRETGHLICVASRSKESTRCGRRQGRPRLCASAAKRRAIHARANRSATGPSRNGSTPRRASRVGRGVHAPTVVQPKRSGTLRSWPRMRQSPKSGRRGGANLYQPAAVRHAVGGASQPRRLARIDQSVLTDLTSAHFFGI